MSTTNQTVNQSVNRYELTDGVEIFSVHYFNTDEIFAAAKAAREASDGNLFYRQNPPNFIYID